jgi:hypothetical protein
MGRTANAGTKLASRTSLILGTFLAIVGGVGSLGAPRAAAQAQNGTMTCSIEAFYLAPHEKEKRKEVIAQTQHQNGWISLRIDISHNPLSMGNRGVARSRYMGPMGDKPRLDQSYHSDLPKEPVTPLNGFRILTTLER